MSAYTPPGVGWLPGPPFPPDLARTPHEVVRYEIARVGETDQVRIWHRPIAALPAAPGYYVAARPTYGTTVVVELLGSPAGQWVDAGDRNYLDEEAVRDLGPLRRLVPLDAITGYLDREAGDAGPDDWRRRAAAAIRAEWEAD